jgi:hypothetical protein
MKTIIESVYYINRTTSFGAFNHYQVCTKTITALCLC